MSILLYLSEGTTLNLFMVSNYSVELTLTSVCFYVRGKLVALYWKESEVRHEGSSTLCVFYVCLYIFFHFLVQPGLNNILRIVHFLRVLAAALRGFDQNFPAER